MPLVKSAKPKSATPAILSGKVFGTLENSRITEQYSTVVHEVQFMF